MKKLSNIQIDDHDREAIEAASQMLKNRFKAVEQVILFGSKARGDDVEDSDIDLLLLTSRPIDWKEREAIIDALFDIEMAHDVRISILVKTSTEWKNGICTAFPVHAEISKEGVLA
jgi:predicted nucleotidyltransferase